MSTDKRALLKQRLQDGTLNLQPLTFPQRELWEASPVPAADRANHISCLIHVRGAITPFTYGLSAGLTPTDVTEVTPRLSARFLPYSENTQLP